jgi:hypothetical protein
MPAPSSRPTRSWLQSPHSKPGGDAARTDPVKCPSATGRGNDGLDLCGGGDGRTNPNLRPAPDARRQTDSEAREASGAPRREAAAETGTAEWPMNNLFPGHHPRPVQKRPRARNRMRCPERRRRGCGRPGGHKPRRAGGCAQDRPDGRPECLDSNSDRRRAGSAILDFNSLAFRPMWNVLRGCQSLLSSVSLQTSGRRRQWPR